MSRRRNSDIKGNERLIFFPTIGHFNGEDNSWHLPIHGWIFKPEVDSLRRAAALGLLYRWLGLEPTGIEAEMLDERLRAFLVGNQPRKVITVCVDGQPYVLGKSAANGHIVDALRLPRDVVETLLAHQAEATGAAPAGKRWLTFNVIMPSGDSRSFGGSVHLLGDEGVSVISDIDDTIKITHVHDRVALLRQTFLRDFESVPGMAALYARWRSAGAAFHYVSRSPWQLYQPLADFLSGHGFPTGTFHMRNFRWKNASTLRPDRNGSKKQTVIEGIVTSLPRRHFVCVGDSGEHDPEIYGQITRRHPDRVRAIFIRDMTGEGRTAARIRRAFAEVPADRWQVFDQPEELPAAIL